jgi:hypothetical protein
VTEYELVFINHGDVDDQLNVFAHTSMSGWSHPGARCTRGMSQWEGVCVSFHTSPLTLPCRSLNHSLSPVTLSPSFLLQHPSESLSFLLTAKEVEDKSGRDRDDRDRRDR